MSEIALKEITKYYGANEVLTNVTFEVQKGEKVGVIGSNGTGKTTIFKIIAGSEHYDRGMLAVRKEASLGYLDQIPSYPVNFRVIDVLNTVFAALRVLEKEIKQTEKAMAEATEEVLAPLVKRYGELVQRFEHHGGYEISEKLNKVYTGLKIADEFRERLFSTLSGGEKTTVELAKILLQSPDILLLDEPTNHLDLDSIEWLEAFLTNYTGTVLIISHDRYFLDKSIGKILEVEDGKIDTYEGNYSYYAEEKHKRLVKQDATYQEQQKKFKAMEKTIKTLKDWGNRGDNAKFHKKAASIQKRLAKIERIEKPQLEKAKIQLDFTTTERSGKNVITIEELSKKYNDQVILDRLNLNVYYGEKIAIVGKNGSGKSTLLKIILKQCQADNGVVKLGANVKLGYLPQNVHFKNESNSVIDTFREHYHLSEGQARGILAKFLFYGEDVFKLVKNLSGGEKSRLKLCQLMHQDINLLILDEPTNHLDIDSREMLEPALSEFAGTLLFISHDRFFINKLAERVCNLVAGKIEVYLGNYNYFKQKSTEQAKQQEICAAVPEKQRKQKMPVRKNEKQDKQLQKIEEEISSLEVDIQEKEQVMLANAHDYLLLERLEAEKIVIKNQLDLLMDKWVNQNL